MFIRLLLIPLLLLASFSSPTYAENSNCVVTIVGTIAAGLTPTLPPGCNTGGNYRFPLNIEVVTGIATEMAAYSGGYAYEGHREHAGLDIGTPIGARVPVFSVSNGTVLAARDSCYIVAQGDDCRIDIVNDGDQYIISYTHVNVNSNIRVGSKVIKGQQIAVVHHWTQFANMDHLHFEMQDKSRLDSLNIPININPRNHFPELQQFKPFGYGDTGHDVRSYTNSTGYFWADDGKEYAETYRNHPPCGGTDCWAH